MQRKKEEIELALDKLNDEETLFQVYSIAKLQISRDALKLEKDRWDPTNIIAFEKQVMNFRLFISAIKIEYRIAGNLDLGLFYLSRPVRTLPIDNKFAYEKAEEHFAEAKKLFDANPSQLRQYRRIFDICIKAAADLVELTSIYMTPFKLNLKKLHDQRIAKSIALPNVLSLAELINNQTNEKKATQATERLFASDKNKADKLALRICDIYTNDPLRKLKGEKEIAENQEKNLELLKMIIPVMHSEMLFIMTDYLKKIVEGHYPEQNIIQLCKNFESAEAKNMQTLFTNYEKMLKELQELLAIPLPAELPNEIKTSFDKKQKELEVDLAKIESCNKIIQEAYTAFVREEKLRNKQRRIFFDALIKREALKQKQLQKKKSSTDQTQPSTKNRPDTHEEQPVHSVKTVNPEDTAYQLYINGKYLDAIKVLKNLLPNKLEQAETLAHFKYIHTIAEYYKSWSEWVMLNNDGGTRQYHQLRKLSYHYKKLANEYYTLAHEGLKKGIALQITNTADYDEWKMWLDLAAMSARPERKYLDKSLVEKAPIQERRLPKYSSSKSESSSTQPVTTVAPKQIEVTKKPPPVIKQEPLNISLSPWVDEQLQSLIKHGVEVHVVGGAVRDTLLGKPAKDNDIVVNCSPIKIKKILHSPGEIRGKTRPILNLNNDEENMELSPLCAPHSGQNQKPVILDDGTITTYTPANSILDDASLRDFTINALYWNLKSKSVLDPTGNGLADLRAGMIRTIIDANLSFQEDPIRMLRAVRLRAKLNFRLEEATQEAIVKNAGVITKANPGRILLELTKCIDDGNLHTNIIELQKLGLLKYIFPAANNLFNSKPSIAGSLIEHMLLLASNPYSPRCYANLPFFLATMLWVPVQEKITELKFSADSDKYQTIVNEMEKILREQEKCLGLTEELQNIIRLIWRNHISREFNQPDLYLINSAYSSDELEVMNSFSEMHSQVSAQIVAYYPTVTTWIPKVDAPKTSLTSPVETGSYKPDSPGKYRLH
ncbi:tRNA nucleotidyltransferase/poly(A) polymerase family protein [Aquicella lusitana]|uniref:tRNA nucleotidyltransferase/poly(A) polymerase n=1 Tax=Aquicella lusitana TaxID=254246 RepID=A0A370GJJ3_9COXI|nr:CCA tRNA nucleotidyltransferase [Aquicella lusitana]RDI43406.1 tRNA nucleotidyltransferase/poly(A) polymerase [Aquicella lusitana]VVC73556.1 Poly(A) polymerase I [Aquicella lusitana]